VRAMQVVMSGVPAQDQPQVSFAGNQHPVQVLGAALAIQRSAIAFARGAWTGVSMTRSCPLRWRRQSGPTPTALLRPLTPPALDLEHPLHRDSWMPGGDILRS
jgi:hypothetical protein